MYSRDSCFFSKIFFLFFVLLPITSFINGVFPVSRNVLAISGLFSSPIYRVSHGKRMFLESPLLFLSKWVGSEEGSL